MKVDKKIETQWVIWLCDNGIRMLLLPIYIPKQRSEENAYQSFSPYH